MSNYPMGAFEALNQMHDKQEAGENAMKEAKAHRIEEMRKGGMVEYATIRRANIQSAASLLEEGLYSDAMKEAAHAWLIGDNEKAHQLFNAACELALDKAVDFLATCDVEAGSW